MHQLNPMCFSNCVCAYIRSTLHFSLLKYVFAVRHVFVRCGIHIVRALHITRYSRVVRLQINMWRLCVHPHRRLTQHVTHLDKMERERNESKPHNANALAYSVCLLFFSLWFRIANGVVVVVVSVHSAKHNKYAVSGWKGMYSHTKSILQRQPTIQRLFV